MRHLLPGPILGAITFILVIANTLFWAIPFFALTLIKILMPTRGMRNRVLLGLIWVAQTWSHCNDGLFAIFQRVEWDVDGLDQLERNRNYLMACNHQSWVDIVVI